MTYTELEQIALEHGFDHTAPLDVSTIDLKPEVREMCGNHNCKKYGNCWSCPPYCGTLEECGARVRAFQRGILVQTVGQLEDEFDGEGMIETETRHKEHFAKMLDTLRTHNLHLLPLGAGACRVCAKCSCPDEPCRFPEKQISSMEAYGMLVLEVCQKNNLQYYYGTNTIAYTSCFLLD